jgi:biopolymer transport protein ExbD
VNLAKAHQKARMAMRRREEQVEQEELEGGEINLIPYLDIVTNLMLFLLASISAGLVLGQINTTLPDRGPKPNSMQNDPRPASEKSLKLIVSVTQDNIIVWSPTDEGGIKNPKATVRRMPDAVDPDTGARDPVPVYDYRALNDAMYKLAEKNWKGKTRVYATYRVTLMPDHLIPYETVIKVMDALRCKLPEETQVAQPCIMPRIAKGEDGKPVIGADGKPVLIGPDGKALEGPYDPDTMALFHDILFSPGFQ